jgi:predicted DNA-binding antitoxin AbrB/MazE fold protein
METIHAIFEDGVFRPTKPVLLPELTEVAFEPRLITRKPNARLEKELAWLANRTADDIERTRHEILSASRPPLPIPAGKTLFDMVEGQWPGDETDEEIREALERIS